MSVIKALVDKLLTNSSNGYMPEGFISEKVLTKQVSKQSSGKLGKYGKQHLRILSDIMGGRGEAKTVEIRQTDSTAYFIEPHGLREVITVEEFDNYEDPFDLESDVMKQLTTLLYLAKEKGLADSLRDPAVITQTVTLSGTDQWNDYSASDPIGDILTARKTIRLNSGAVPDTMIMDYDTADVLRYHPAILRNLGFADARAGQLSNEDLAKAFQVKRFLVADVMYNNSKPGQADVMASIWGKDVILCVSPENPEKWQTTLGYLVQKSGEGPRQVFKQNIENPPGAKSIIVKDSYDMVLVDVKAAYLIKDAIA